MFQKILVALDKSEASYQTFQAAMAMAKALKANLMIVNVLSPLDASYPSPIYSIRAAYPIAPETMQLYVQQWQVAEQEGLEFLRSQTSVSTAAGIPTEFTQAIGDPGHEICALARSWDANLILIGRRGYRGLGELFIGSVSNYVMHHAHCSVLTVQGSVDLEVPDQSTASANESAEPEAIPV